MGGGGGVQSRRNRFLWQSMLGNMTISILHCDFNVYLFKVHKKLTLVTCISKHFYLDKITVIKLFYALITAAGCN